MRSRDESTAESLVQRPEPERAAPQNERIAQFLRLQQSAGNQALARHLLQRDPAEGTITPGPQGHHPKYEYAFGGGEKKAYDLDGWITGKSKATPLEHGGTLSEAAIVNLINTWDTSKTIFEAVNLAFVLVSAGSWGARTDGESGEKGTFDVKPAVAGNDAGKVFAAHFLTLEKNIALRVGDIPNNVPTTIKVKCQEGKKNAEAKTYKPDWPAALSRARAKLKPKLLANEDAPIKENIRLIDDVVLNDNVDAAIKALRDLKMITDKGGGAAKWSNKGVSGSGIKTTTTHVSFDPDKEFNFGLNHLRFILYLEWRGMNELRRSPPTGS